VEGFAPSRHIKKADGTNAAVEEQLEFKVIEFSKDQRKIVVSHTRIHDEQVREEKETKKADKRNDSNETKKAVKKLKDSNEKSTLGDFEALSQLKSDLAEKEKGQKGEEDNS
jgi:small subunit ribosomal protein S1